MIAAGQSHDHDHDLRDDWDAADEIPETVSQGEGRSGAAQGDAPETAQEAPDASPGRRRRRRHEHTRLLRGWRRRVGRR